MQGANKIASYMFEVTVLDKAKQWELMHVAIIYVEFRQTKLGVML